METSILILFFILVTAALWFTGVWGSLLSLINILLSGMIASAFFEPLATRIESMNDSAGQYTYLLDFVCLWLIFFLSASMIRMLTDSFSAIRLKFDIVTEMVGRSLISLTAAWFFICFASFTLWTAPLPIPEGGFKVEGRSPMAPDAVWLSLIHSRSKGALSEYKDAMFFGEFEDELHTDDEELDARVFDSKAQFILKYIHRREVFATSETARVSR